VGVRLLKLGLLAGAARTLKLPGSIDQSLTSGVSSLTLQNSARGTLKTLIEAVQESKEMAAELEAATPVPFGGRVRRRKPDLVMPASLRNVAPFTL
jgi:hypothetical protein